MLFAIKVGGLLKQKQGVLQVSKIVEKVHFFPEVIFRLQRHATASKKSEKKDKIEVFFSDKSKIGHIWMLLI